MVLIAGGTGRLGTRVVELLTKRNLRVRVLTRDRERAQHLPDVVEVVEGDVRNTTALPAATAGVTAVISAIQGLNDPKSNPWATDRDGNRNLINAAKASGVEQFIFVSGMGASPNHPMSINRAKYEAELSLKQSGLAWTIIRPPAFMEFWAQLVGQPILDTGRTRVFGRGNNAVNFVSINDVAVAVERAVIDPAMRGVEIEVGGPENLTVNQVVKVFEKVGGKKAQVSHVPLPAMRVMSVALRLFNPAMARIIEGGVTMDTTDQTWDGSANRSRYPWLPQTPLIEVIHKQVKRPLTA